MAFDKVGGGEGTARPRPRAAVAPATAGLIAGIQALCLASGLAGCGGGSEVAPPVAVDLVRWAPGQAPAPSVEPQAGTHGLASDVETAAEPADVASRTRAGRYLTAAGAVQLEQQRPGGVLAVVVPCCSGGDLELGLALAAAMAAALDLGRDATVIVQGHDPRTAATLANQLADQGHRDVWLVVPGR